MDILLADLQLRGNPSISEHMVVLPPVQCASNKEQKSHKVLPDNLYNDFDFIRNIISPSRSRLSVPMIATAFKKKKLFEISLK